MQREYLFRGKRRDNGSWMFGLIGYDSGGGYGRISGWMGDDGGEKFNDVEVISETVGQYTGLKDRNEKKIFEGDIVNAYDHPTGVDSRIGVVELMRGCWGVSDSIVALSDYGTAWIDVIGNIYDNPHLLNPAGGTASSINMQHDPKEQTEPAQEAAEQATETTTANSEAGEATDTEAGGE